MRGCLVFFAILVMVYANTYSTEDDNADGDRALEKDRLLTEYTRCISGEVPCTLEANDLKKITPDMLESDCAECSESQKSGSKHVDDWETKQPRDRDRPTANQDRYDEYQKRYEASQETKEA